MRRLSRTPPPEDVMSADDWAEHLRRRDAHANYVPPRELARRERQREEEARVAAISTPAEIIAELIDRYDYDRGSEKDTIIVIAKAWLAKNA